MKDRHPAEIELELERERNIPDPAVPQETPQGWPLIDPLTGHSRKLPGDLAREEQAEHEARAYALSRVPGEHIRPRDLQSVSKGALPWNAACRVLEALEKEGELVRATDPNYGGELVHLSRAETLVWQRAKPAGTTSRGYALPLTQKEHGALLRLLDEHFRDPYNSSDDALLRAIRARLKRPA